MISFADEMFTTQCTFLFNFTVIHATTRRRLFATSIIVVIAATVFWPRDNKMTSCRWVGRLTGKAGTYLLGLQSDRKLAQTTYSSSLTSFCFLCSLRLVHVPLTQNFIRDSFGFDCHFEIRLGRPQSLFEPHFTTLKHNDIPPPYCTNGSQIWCDMPSC